jgi:hypothetical protein
MDMYGVQLMYTIEAQRYSWCAFFNAMVKFEADRDEQKRQGLNDFTSLGAVLSINDEVRLHTRFIYALLNPEGKHYQGIKFLELFLCCIGRQGWFDFSSVKIHREYCPTGKGEQIDLYITDGSKQILIENKLNAKDQKCQVSRYLNVVGATDPATSDNTLFIYLTKGRKTPSSYALGDLSVCRQTSRILNAEGKPVALYQNLNYRSNTSETSIHRWLEDCAGLVQKTSNIYWAIADYIEVVERAAREYVSKVKTLKDFLEEGISEGKDYHIQAIQLARELPAVQRSWLDAALTVAIDELFELLVCKGSLLRIDKDNVSLLDPFVKGRKDFNLDQLLYEPRYNFFLERSKGNINRGAFFLVTRGPFATRVMLTLFYGVSALHVGCLLARDATEAENSVVKGLGLSEPKALRSSIFPGAFTKSSPMALQGIIDLANFSSSPQKSVLEILVTRLVSE